MTNRNIVIIRADASAAIGAGHIMRCLALASVLKDNGARVIFICRDLPGNLGSVIRQKGFEAKLFSGGISWQEDAASTIGMIKALRIVDWLIVDHYGLDYCWEEKLSSYTRKVMAIDDIADRRHSCDILLDQNIETNADRLYSLMNNPCRLLVGPEFLMLRKVFADARAALKPKDGRITRILVSFGGSDPTNETAKALQAMQSIDRSNFSIDVVVGLSNPHQDEIRKLCYCMGAAFYCQIDNIHELMASADLALGACGTTTWERFCLGLPSIVVAVADNQIEGAEYLSSNGLVTYLGIAEAVTVSSYEQSLREALNNPRQLTAMGARISRLIDGMGIYRVAQAMINDE